MTDGVEWAFEIRDGITGPANDMRSSVAGLEAQMKKTDAAIGASHDGAAKHTEGAFGKMLESAKGFSEGFFFVTEGISTAAEAVSKTFESIVGVAEKVFDLSDFRRNALLGLDAMLSTGFQANEVLERLEGWARQTGFAKDTFVTFGRQLLGAGFKEGELKPLLAGLSDVQAVNGGQVQAAQELLSQIVRIKSLDKVNSRELATLGSLGIAPEKIYEYVAQQRHLTIAQAKALFDESGGGLKGTEAINDILGAVRTGIDKGGDLGMAGEAQSLGSIPAQIQKMKDAFSGLFEHIDTTKFASGLRHITEQFTGDQGEKLAQSVSSVFGKLGDWISKIDFTKVGAGIGEFADGLATATSYATDLFGGISEGWAQVSPAIDAMATGIASAFGDTPGGGGSSLKVFGQLIGEVVGGIVVFGEAGIYALEALKDTFVPFVEAASWMRTAFENIGSEVVGGLWSGIKAAWGGMLDDFHALVALLPAGVKHVLGIASPSKVFAGLGVQTMQGFAVGMESVPVYDRMADVVRPQRFQAEVGALRPNAVNLGGAIGAGGGAGGHITLQLNAPIHVDGSKDPSATAHELVGEMRRVFLPELGAAFDQLRAEVGG